MKEEMKSKSMELPEHVRKMGAGGYACMHCGGEVDEEGYSLGGYDGDEDEEPAQGMSLDEQFAKAVKGKG